MDSPVVTYNKKPAPSANDKPSARGNCDREGQLIGQDAIAKVSGDVMQGVVVAPLGY
jgi:hypothetical protein